jgi:DNA-binding GntR family transcriptional regulator
MEYLKSKVQPQSLVKTLTDRIEAAIICGELKPGERLSEQALAATLGVSRGPLREAIRVLEGRKLLDREPNIGVRIAALSTKDLHEILQIREPLEGLACALAANNMSDIEIAGLKQLLGQHEQQNRGEDGEGYFQEPRDFDFHYRIVNGSGNQRLVEMLTGDLYYPVRVYRYKSSTQPGRATTALREHEGILAAIAGHDPVTAEQKMREHVRNARLSVEAQLTAEEEAAEVTKRLS